MRGEPVREELFYMKRKIGMLAAAGILSAAALAGCSSQTAETAAETTTAAETAAETEASSEETAEDTTAEETPAESTTVTQTEPLVVYLNDFDAIITELFKEATGYDVEVVVGNGAETMARIETEGDNPQWDVVWLDSMPSIYALGAQGRLLTDWEPSNAANLKEYFQEIVPADKAYYPTGAHAAGVIAYRNDVYTEETAPTTWEDLTSEEYKDQVGMADPSVAAPAYPFVSWFFNSMDMEGGKEYFSSMFDNGLKIYPKNPQVVQALASGEISVAALQESNAYGMVASGEPITIVWPEEGAPASVRVAGISAKTEQPEVAKAFVEFLLDPETQQALVDSGDEGYFEPSAEGVTPKTDRATDTNLVYADAAWASEHEAEIKEWFADASVQ